MPWRRWGESSPYGLTEASHNQGEATTKRGWVRGALALLWIRLRIPMFLVLSGVVVGRWDEITSTWRLLTRRVPLEQINLHAVSPDTEYFCPMDPGVLSDWPGRCGVCNMTLVRRRRGEAVMLPEGVVARMQISPYRLQLAGIRTERAGFEDLAREAKAPGTVSRDGKKAVVTVNFAIRERPYLAVGMPAEVSSPDLPGHDAFAGTIRALTNERDGEWRSIRAEIELKGSDEALEAGMVATVKVATPVSAIEPFRSLPSDPPAYSASEPKRIYRCPDHRETLLLEAGRCAIDRKLAEPVLLTDLQRVRWWCPMHKSVTADRAGALCPQCGGMALIPRIVSYRPAGKVLAIPESAVVDTGDRKLVFVETMPGMFDGVEVTLGPRCGARYPVVRGLEPGQRVAVTGAFLLEAESRLNPALAAGYFGAGRGDRAGTAGGVAVDRAGQPKAGGAEGSTRAALDELAAEDRSAAERQGKCPVTGMSLGSMGAPKRMTVEGRTVFLCCAGCEPKVRAEPAKYLARLGDQGRP